MKVAARIGRETLAQMLGFAVQLLDRIVTAGVLVRLWGVNDFAAWSLALAAAGMLAIVDFGVNLYFANRVFSLVQQGRGYAARVLHRAGNLAMVGVSALGLAVVILGFHAFATLSTGTAVTPELWTATLLITVGMFVRAGVTIQMSVYRAHVLYARQSLLMTGSDLARIVAILATVALGGGLVAAALAFCLMSIATFGAIVLLDSRRLFPEFPFRFGPMPRRERAVAWRLSLGFWLNSAPSTALTYLPVFLLSDAGSRFVVAQFVLMRTLANFVRAALQPFSVVFGQESARRTILGDLEGQSSTYRESTFLLGVLGAVPAGLLLAAGGDFFQVWSARADMFDPAMLLLAIAPPLLLPSVAMAASHLSTVNDPWPLATGRVLQFTLAIMAYFALPIASDGLRMMAALALAELIGNGLVFSWRVRRTIANTGFGFQAEMIARTLSATLLCYGAAWAAMLPLEGALLRLIAASIGAGAGGVIALWLFGLSGARRSALLSAVRVRLGRA